MGIFQILKPPLQQKVHCTMECIPEDTLPSVENYEIFALNATTDSRVARLQQESKPDVQIPRGGRSALEVYS